MRCNTGLAPKYLADQWLIAEQVELLMIPGLLRRLNYKINNPIPDHFVLGKGHMTFWFNKLLYLHNRHEEVKLEVARRCFKVTDKSIDISNMPQELCNDWRPTASDTSTLRSRLLWKIDTKLNTKWRYYRHELNNLSVYKDEIINAGLYWV